MAFHGFDRDTFLLLAENKFNDSKPFYDSVKDQIKQKAIEPMREICTELADQLFELDDQMNLIPVKMVSRIRRDTRRAKNKEMYRENVWAMFMRHKYEWSYQPCMWFEIMPGGYSMGVGMYDADTAYLSHFREAMLQNQDAFRSAVQQAHSVGAVESVERYAKDKPGEIAKDLRPYYQAKTLYFIRYCNDMEPLFNGAVLDELRRCFAAFAPMYRFLLGVMETTIAERGKHYDKRV